MTDVSRNPIQGPVVEEQVEFTFVELSRAIGADEEQITALIVEGVIEPIEPSRGDARGAGAVLDQTATVHAVRTQWRFSGAALGRARLALRLSRDLEVNAPGVALALDLIDEIDELRARLRRLGR